MLVRGTPKKLNACGLTTLLALAIFFIPSRPICGAPKLSDSALAQIAALEDEKDAFTPAQKKMDSRLVFSLKQSRGETIAKNAAPFLRIENRADTNGMVEVRISGLVTSNLLALIQSAGGQVLGGLRVSPLSARVPLSQLEKLADLPEVKTIAPAAGMHPNMNAIDEEGIAAMAASSSTLEYYYGLSANGGGIKIGVLSDSVDFLAEAQASNDLGPVTVLPGQSGVPGTGEGTALLEIVHAVAPGAQLFFATSRPAEEQFATNILDLRFKYGCNIILDDVQVEEETPFQDGAVAQAISTVVSNGAVYLTSAGNDGNAASGTSGTWEGDFNSDGPASAPLKGKGQVHNFGNYLGSPDEDTVWFPSISQTELFWSDPWGASTNDYDLFVLDTNGLNVVESSVNPQNGSQDPFEAVPAPRTNEQVVVVLVHGTGRFLHLTTQRGVLSVGTVGAVRGHNACTNALSIAAINGEDVLVDRSDNFEPFNSDGPRQMFYWADGTPMTPGDFSSSGGITFQKPDLLGPDAVTTTVLDPFYGTSAAVANVAGLAALIASASPSLSPALVAGFMESNTYNQFNYGSDDVGYGAVITGSYLYGLPAYTGVPIISLQPPNQQTVAFGAPFFLSAAVLGAQPISYQWRLNGATLTDADQFSSSSFDNLLVAGTSLSNAGAYTLTASNSLGVATSLKTSVSFAPIQILATLNDISNYAGAISFTEAGVVEGPDGNFYGTTEEGGTNGGLGVLFSTTPGGDLTVLYNFGSAANDGNDPNSLVLASDGNFYGTTSGGGIGENTGTIFKYSPDGQYTILYDFTNGVDGSYPLCGLSLGLDGLLYGTTSTGPNNGFGTIYSVTTSGQLTVLYTFLNAGDGANPSAAPILGRDGSLYGTTSGYITAQIPGTIYKLSPGGQLKTLYTFTNGLDGSSPWAGLTAGPDGNYYGVVATGGMSDMFGNNGGIVYRITPKGQFTIIHAFDLVSEGMQPIGKLVLGQDNNFYGTTAGGGPGYALAEEASPFFPSPGGLLLGADAGYGSVFKMTPSGKITVLYFFTGNADGGVPGSDLFAATDGNIYGIAGGAPPLFGEDIGTVFRIAPEGFGPAIVRQPQNQLVVAGSNAVFTVPSDGAPPLLYQWQFNGAAIAGATNSFLVVTNVQAKQLGSYRVAIRNPVGSLTSSSATLSVGAPVAILHQPQNQNVTAGAKASFSVSATGAAPIAYQWQFDGANIFGATASTLVLQSVNYTNIGSYSVLVSNGLNAVMSGNAVLAVSPPPPAILSPPNLFQSSSNSVNVVGKTGPPGVTNVLVRANAGPWQAASIFNNGAGWSALVSLVPGTNDIQAVAETPGGASQPAARAYLFNPFINAAGVYGGLFLDTNNPSLQSAGSVTLTVSSTRSFTGKITRAADAPSFSGAFNLNGQAQVTATGARPGPLGLSLLLDLDPGAYALSGFVSNRGVFNAPLSAWPALGSVTNYPAVSTFAIFSNGAPTGYSYGDALLGSKGNVNLQAYLFDGTSFNARGSLLQNGLFPLFAPLYKGGGSMMAWVMFTPSGLSASVDWFKTNGVLLTNLNLSGLPFVPPRQGPVLTLTNGGLELFAGGLPDALSNTIAISPKNLVSSGAGTIRNLSVSLASTTGFFSGSFLYPSSGRKVTFQGALFPPINSGLGYFIESNQPGGVIIGDLPFTNSTP